MRKKSRRWCYRGSATARQDFVDCSWYGDGDTHERRKWISSKCTILGWLDGWMEGFKKQLVYCWGLLSVKVLGCQKIFARGINSEFQNYVYFRPFIILSLNRLLALDTHWTTGYRKHQNQLRNTLAHRFGIQQCQCLCHIGQALNQTAFPSRKEKGKQNLQELLKSMNVSRHSTCQGKASELTYGCCGGG